MALKFMGGLLLAATLAVGHGAAAQGDAEFELRIEGRIEIGPDGRVIEYDIDEDETSEPVESLVAAAVSRWRFEPIIEDGRPVIGVTEMRLQLAAVPLEEDYQLRIDSVAFGPESERLTPPRYPERLLREDVGGKVVLVLRVMPDGHVARVHVERVGLTRDGRGGDPARWRTALGEAAAEAAMQWSFDGFEIVDGNPRGSDVRIPVEFSIGERGEWTELAQHRGESTPAPWLDVPQVAAADEGSSGPAVTGPLDSRFRLKTKVVGTIL